MIDRTVDPLGDGDLRGPAEVYSCALHREVVVGTHIADGEAAEAVFCVEGATLEVVPAFDDGGDGVGNGGGDGRDGLGVAEFLGEGTDEVPKVGGLPVGDEV